MFVYIDSAIVYLHSVSMGSVVDFSELSSVSIFTVDVSSMGMYIHVCVFVGPTELQGSG
jgi:hypothetical protein